jgi:hypothetical protein
VARLWRGGDWINFFKLWAGSPVMGKHVVI